MLMDAGRDHDVMRFAAISEHLRGLGYSAPAIIDHDESAGLLLIEDLGDGVVAGELEWKPDLETECYETAVDLLCDLAEQTPPARVQYREAERELPTYNLRELWREASLLTEWWLPAAGAGAMDDSGAGAGTFAEGKSGEGAVPIAGDETVLELRAGPGGKSVAGANNGTDAGKGTDAGARVGTGDMTDAGASTGTDAVASAAAGEVVAAEARSEAEANAGEVALVENSLDAEVETGKEAGKGVVADVNAIAEAETSDISGRSAGVEAGKVAGSVLDSELVEEYQRLIESACRNVVDCRTALTLRDYHAENLIWLPQRQGLARLGLLDFQDAVCGHPAYDLVSLLEDARRDTTAELRLAMTERYRERSGLGGDDWEDFLYACSTLGAQRNLKIIGIFARLCTRDGKGQYLALLPRVWQHLMNDLSHPDLAPLAKWVKQHVPPPDPTAIERASRR